MSGEIRWRWRKYTEDVQTLPKVLSPIDSREIVESPIARTQIVEREEEKVFGSEDSIVFWMGW